MAEDIECLDSGVYVKFLVVEDPPALADAAARVVHRALSQARLVAPAFAWAEVGSTLRKKVRRRAITIVEANVAWTDFLRLPIEFFDLPAIRMCAWQIAGQFGHDTLYDAAFLACTEFAPAPQTATRTFWTADERLLRSFNTNRPPYVRWLGEA